MTRNLRMIDSEKTTVTKPQTNADKPKASPDSIADSFVVVDGRGGISVDLSRMLSSEKGKRSIEKLRRVRIQKNN